MLQVITVIGAMLILVFSSSAQTSSGSISGTVVDTQQAAVANAAVTLTEQARKTTASTRTDAEGRFVFPQLLPGKYTLTVESPGFKKAERADITLLANDKISAGVIPLELGTVSESVEVTATAVLLKTESSERSAALPLRSSKTSRSIRAAICSLPACCPA